MASFANEKTPVVAAESADPVVESVDPVVEVKPLAHTVDLKFAYDGKEVIHGITTEIQPGSRVILVGSNGAGKSTLLRLFAGKYLIPRGTEFEVLGRRSPQDQLNGLAFLGNNWQRTVAFAGNGVSYQADIPVKKMSQKMQEKYPERRDMLYRLLEIDPDWRMHKVSDGQRRRVQIMLALCRPFKLLLLDEMTVDLDVLARAELLNFLKRESEERGAAIVYTTHIFDGLDGWGTHLMHVRDGRMTINQEINSIDALQTLRDTPGIVSPLLKYIHSILWNEREERRQQERETGVTKYERAEYGDADTVHDGTQGGWSSGRFYDYW